MNQFAASRKLMKQMTGGRFKKGRRGVSRLDFNSGRTTALPFSQ